MEWLIAVAILMLAGVLSGGIRLLSIHWQAQEVAEGLRRQHEADAANLHWRRLYDSLQSLWEVAAAQAAEQAHTNDQLRESLHDWRSRQEALEAAIWHLAVNTQKDRPAQVMKLR